MDALYILLVLCVVALLCFLLSRRGSGSHVTLSGLHVFVTGGSSGIGLALAMEVARRGARVTIAARNKQRLDEAQKAIEAAKTEESKVMALSVDLGGDYDKVKAAVAEAEAALGPVDVLMNSAGTSVSGRFEDLPLGEFQRMMTVNYLGSVHVTRALLPGMKARRAGRLVFLSSQAGQIGLFGYSAYAASKFALRGLAETLQMEVKPYNISVTVAHPPDTDTPGYAEEMKDKPRETALISETAGLFTANYVAQKILRDAMHGKFLCAIGVDGWLLSILTCGMSPIPTLFESVQQVFLMGIFRLISLFYLQSFDSIVKKCKQERDVHDSAEHKQK